MSLTAPVLMKMSPKLDADTATSHNYTQWLHIPAEFQSYPPPPNNNEVHIDDFAEMITQHEEDHPLCGQQFQT